MEHKRSGGWGEPKPAGLLTRFLHSFTAHEQVCMQVFAVSFYDQVVGVPTSDAVRQVVRPCEREAPKPEAPIDVTYDLIPEHLLREMTKSARGLRFVKRS